MDVAPEVGPVARSRVVPEVVVGAAQGKRQHVLGQGGPGDVHGVDAEHAHEEGRHVAAHGHPELMGVLYRTGVLGEVRGIHDIGTTQRPVHVSVLPGRADRLGVGRRPIVRLVDDSGEGSGIGPVLDLEAVEVQPPQVDGERRHPHEHHE